MQNQLTPEEIQRKKHSQEVRETEDASLPDETYSFDEENTENEEFHDIDDMDDDSSDLTEYFKYDDE